MAISHTNCTHPRTPAGRRACRAAVAKGTTLDMTPARSAEMDRQVKAFSDAFNTVKTEIDVFHCSGCGSTDIHDSADGYTGCCNEPLVRGCASRCTH